MQSAKKKYLLLESEGGNTPLVDNYESLATVTHVTNVTFQCSPSQVPKLAGASHYAFNLTKGSLHTISDRTYESDFTSSLCAFLLLFSSLRCSYSWRACAPLCAAHFRRSRAVVRLRGQAERRCQTKRRNRPRQEGGDERAAEVGGALTSSEETAAAILRYGSQPCNCFLEAFSPTHSHLRVGGGDNRELSLAQLAALSRRFECVHVCRGALFSAFPELPF